MQNIYQHISDRITDKLMSLSLELSFRTELPAFEHCEVITEDLPDWWLPNNNTLLMPRGMKIPHIVIHPGIAPPKNFIITTCADAGLNHIMCWGQAGIILIGSRVNLGGGVLACGSESVVVLGDDVRCTSNPTLNARNGGLIYVGADGLWASGVTILTDDMHAIRDLETGRRLNAFGGKVVIGRHVWLGLEALIMHGAVIGHDVVVGARSIVNMPLSPNAVYAGVPARLVRNDITWAFEDEP